jgi:Dolichyl-phosphate-mannose-protein mannosyltransferase
LIGLSGEYTRDVTDGTALRAEPGGRGRDARSRLLRTVDVALSQDAATYVVVTALLAGVALRVAVYTSSLMGFDADEAVWGLMARRVLHGEVSTFFWGQNHGGTQEVLLTSLVFAPFGSSVLALRVVPIVLSAVSAYLVWRVGRRTIGEPAARIAAALFWVWPVYSVWKLGHAHGFYASGVLYCALILLLALRLAEENSPRRCRSCRSWPGRSSGSPGSTRESG